MGSQVGNQASLGHGHGCRCFAATEWVAAWQAALLELDGQSPLPLPPSHTLPYSHPTPVPSAARSPAHGHRLAAELPLPHQQAVTDFLGALDVALGHDLRRKGSARRQVLCASASPLARQWRHCTLPCEGSSAVNAAAGTLVMQAPVHLQAHSNCNQRTWVKVSWMRSHVFSSSCDGKGRRCSAAVAGHGREAALQPPGRAGSSCCHAVRMCF